MGKERGDRHICVRPGLPLLVFREAKGAEVVLRSSLVVPVANYFTLEVVRELLQSPPVLTKNVDFREEVGRRKFEDRGRHVTPHRALIVEGDDVDGEAEEQQSDLATRQHRERVRRRRSLFARRRRRATMMRRRIWAGAAQVQADPRPITESGTFSSQKGRDLIFCPNLAEVPVHPSLRLNPPSPYKLLPSSSSFLTRRRLIFNSQTLYVHLVLRPPFADCSLCFSSV